MQTYFYNYRRDIASLHLVRAWLQSVKLRGDEEKLVNIFTGTVLRKLTLKPLKTLKKQQKTKKSLKKQLKMMSRAFQYGRRKRRDVLLKNRTT